VRVNDCGLGSIIVHIGQELLEASLVLDFGKYGGDAIDLCCVDYTSSRDLGTGKSGLLQLWDKISRGGFW